MSAVDHELEVELLALVALSFDFQSLQFFGSLFLGFDCSLQWSSFLVRGFLLFNFFGLFSRLLLSSNCRLLLGSWFFVSRSISLAFRSSSWGRSSSSRSNGGRSRRSSSGGKN